MKGALLAGRSFRFSAMLLGKPYRLGHRESLCPGRRLILFCRLRNRAYVLSTETEVTMGTRMYPVFSSVAAERAVVCAAMGITLAVWDKLEAWKGELVALQTAHWQGNGSHEAVEAHYDALYADDELSKLYSFELNGFGKVVPQAYGLMGVEPSEYGSAEGVTAKRGMLAQVLYRAQDGSFSWWLEIAQHPDVVGCAWN